jgi:hypothetical protein
MGWFIMRLLLKSWRLPFSSGSELTGKVKGFKNRMLI